jgi:CheY-like chemotaxis protein
MMPIMDGWRFRDAQLADEALSRIPVVVMTAAADLTRSPIAAAQIVPKPVTTKVLLAAIAKHARS